MEFRRVLIIEDNSGDARLIREALKEAKLKFEVTHVNDGEQAIDLVKRCEYTDGTRPDLILLDLNLPKWNGWQVFSAIRAQPCLQEIPVVIFTSSPNPMDRMRAESADRSTYIRKPATLEEFMAVGREIRRFAEEYWGTA